MSINPVNRCKLPPAFWRAMQQQGLSPAALLRQARLPATLHVTDHALVTTDQLFGLYQAIAELSKDPAIGLTLAEGTDTSLNPPSLLTAFYAKDYRDGLMRVARFKQVCTPEKLHLHEEEGRATLTTEWPHATVPEPVVSVDIGFAVLLELGRRGSGRRLVPALVELAQPAPQHSRYRDYFGTEVRYGAGRNALHLHIADLSLEIGRAHV